MRQEEDSRFATHDVRSLNSISKLIKIGLRSQPANCQMPEVPLGFTGIVCNDRHGNHSIFVYRELDQRLIAFQSGNVHRHRASAGEVSKVKNARSNASVHGFVTSSLRVLWLAEYILILGSPAIAAHIVRWSLLCFGNACKESVKLIKVRVGDPVVVIGVFDCNELFGFVSRPEEFFARRKRNRSIHVSMTL